MNFRMNVALATAPPLDSAGCLGLIVTCLNRSCSFRNWLNLCDLPPGITAPSIAKRARCGTCGHKGANVEVVQPKSAMGLAGGVPASENIAHAQELKQFIREHPFGSRPEAIKQ
jgi:hypothetical protein